MRLDPDGIRHGMASADAWDIHVVDEVDSTNDGVLHVLPAADEAEAGMLGSVLFAEEQTAGRGRRGHAWFSGPAGSNLLFSCAVRPRWPIRYWGRLTHVTALALKRALDGIAMAQPLVKWPNDVYVNDRKVSGILVETEMRGAGEALAVIGIGINVNVSAGEIPEDLQGLATSLRAETGTWIDRERLAGTILDGLAECLRASEDAFDGVLDELREAHYLLGRRVRVRTGQVVEVGQAIDLGPEGELIVEWPGGDCRPLSSADEVRLIGQST